MTHRNRTCNRNMLALFLLPLVAGCATLGLDRPMPNSAPSDIPQAVSLDPAHAKALYLAVVEGLHKQDQSRAALAYLDDFDLKYPGDQYAVLLRAQCLTDIGQTDDAGPIYRSLRNGPYAGAANAGLGTIAGAGGNWSEADARFEEAVRVEPTKAEYINDLGFARIRHGEYQSGIVLLTRAAQLDPANQFIRNNLILGLHLAGRDNDADRLIDGIADPSDRKKTKSLLLMSVSALAGARNVALNMEGGR